MGLGRVRQVGLGRVRQVGLGRVRQGRVGWVGRGGWTPHLQTSQWCTHLAATSHSNSTTVAHSPRVVSKAAPLHHALSGCQKHQLHKDMDYSESCSASTS